MVLMNLIASALAVSAPVQPRGACELAPAYGQGLSDEGRIDNLTVLSFSCGYRALQYQQFSLWPLLGIDTQTWSIDHSKDGRQEMSTYEAQNLVAGLRSSYEISPSWNLAYAFTLAQGKGSLERNISNPQSSLSESYDGLQQRSRTHTIAVERRLSDRLALTLGVQRIDSHQSWNGGKGSRFLESVNEAQVLSLTSNPEVPAPQRDRSRHTSSAFKLGLNFFFP